MTPQEIIDKYNGLIEQGFLFDQYGVSGCNSKEDGSVINLADLQNWMLNNQGEDCSDIRVKSQNAFCNGLPVVANRRLYNELTDVRIAYPTTTDEDIVEVSKDGCIIKIKIQPLIVGTGSGIPTILVTTPKTISRNENTEMLLSIPISGGTPTTYVWKLNGTVITTQTDAILYIPQVSGADAGTYNLTVSNDLGTDSKDVLTLTTNVICNAPTIQQQPSNSTVISGGNATFKVVASGTGVLTYQWYKNDILIPGATNSSFTITSTALTDTGSKFNVIITNTCGNITSNYGVLTVNAAVVPFTAYAGHFGSTNPLSTIQAGSETLTFQSTAQFNPGSNMVFDMQHFSDTGDEYMVIKYPKVQGTYKTWYQYDLNQGTIPDQNWLDIVTSGDWNYIVSRTPISMQQTSGTTKFSK